MQKRQKNLVPSLEEEISCTKCQSPNRPPGVSLGCVLTASRLVLSSHISTCGSKSDSFPVWSLHVRLKLWPNTPVVIVSYWSIGSLFQKTQIANLLKESVEVVRSGDKCLLPTEPTCQPKLQAFYKLAANWELTGINEIFFNFSVN